MDIHESIRHYDKRAIWLVSFGGKSLFEFRKVVNRKRFRLKSEGGSGILEWIQINLRIWGRRRIEYHRDLPNARRNLLQQLQPFGCNCRLHNHETSCVASRPRQGLDKAAGDWIGDNYKDRRNSVLLTPCARMTARTPAAR